MKTYCISLADGQMITGTYPYDLKTTVEKLCNLDDCDSTLKEINIDETEVACEWPHESNNNLLYQNLEDAKREATKLAVEEYELLDGGDFEQVWLIENGKMTVQQPSA